MKRLTTYSLLLAAAFLNGALTLSAREMEIRQAAEIEIQTERGHYYQLQRSTNLVDWQDVNDRIYGHGGVEYRLRSAHSDDGAPYEFFRVVVSDAPTNGHAPDSLAGVTINMDNRPGGDVMQFLTETNGVDQGTSPDPFVYTLTRISTNEVRVETHPPTYYFDRRNVIIFHYNTPTSGTWVRDEFRRGQLKDRDVGVFSYVTDGNNPGNTNEVPTEIPVALAGLAYTFQSGEHPDRLEFTSAMGGTEFGDDGGDDELNVFSYVYTLTASNTASLVVTFSATKRDEYYLVYNGPAQGSFTRREFKDGQLDDIDTGVFSIVKLPPNNQTNTPPPIGPMPTDTLAGLTYVMNDGGTVLTKLIVTSSTAGTELDDSAPSQFTYTYTVTGMHSATLIVRFKVDKWDEYSLTFSNGTNTGTFVRREYDRNVLKDTDTGTFTGAPTTP